MTATTLNQLPEGPAALRQDWKIIGVIGVAHSYSHFYQLVLPTLFLPLAAEFGYGFSELGLLASVFFLASSLMQASSGFVVDRMGPTPVLRFGLGCFAVSAILLGLAGGYAPLLLAAAIGGAGNGVFHPADYSILNHRVSTSRLGHAYSTHGFTGNLGWALTPVFMTTIIHFADWRTAAFGASVLAILILLLVWFNNGLLTGRNAVRGSQADASQEAREEGGSLADKSAAQMLMTLIRQPALWGAFFFFAFTSIALSAVQNYTIPMLGDVYGIDKVLAGTTLSGYMAASAVGMLTGGFLVSATPRTELTVAASLIFAGLFLIVLSLGVLPPAWAMVIVGFAGFSAGIATPSRDMLIRRVTPKGATGTVYGLVYSGMDVGSSVAPIGFGIMLDVGLSQGPWAGAAIAFVIAAVTALMVARSVPAASAATAAAKG